MCQQLNSRIIEVSKNTISRPWKLVGVSSSSISLHIGFNGQLLFAKTRIIWSPWPDLSHTPGENNLFRKSNDRAMKTVA